MPDSRSPSFRRRLVAGIVLVILLFLVYQVASWLTDPRGRSFTRWLAADPQARESLMTVRKDACPGAPFVLPADGFVGLLYADPRGPYSRTRPHQGIDIFSPDRATPGQVPVYAAYDGYISREGDWRSSLIQRIPADPLQPSRQIWLYYAHMADRDGSDFIVDAFPPGTRETYVEQGTLLGYTGNYNGESARTIWVHLHFSIVQDDGSGRYSNELEFANTLDPTPYLGMGLNYACAAEVVGCGSIGDCPGS